MRENIQHPFTIAAGLAIALFLVCVVNAQPQFAQTMSAPTNLQATFVSNIQIDLTWSDTNTDETGFTIEESINNGPWTPISGTIAADSITATVTPQTFFRCGSIYAFRMQAYNNIDTSPYSNIASVATSACAITLAAPTNLVATQVTTNQVSLVWKDNSATEDGFTVEESMNNGLWNIVGEIPANRTTWTRTLEISSTCITTRTYRIRAFNNTEASEYTIPTTITINSCPTLAAPTNLTAKALSSHDIILRWEDNSKDEQEFQIERSRDVVEWTQIATTTANTQGYFDSALQCDTTYVYRVRAARANTMSDYSNVVSATTLACLPTAPISLTVKAISPTAIGLTWQDTTNNTAKFSIERSEGLVTWTRIATTTTGTTSYTDGQLTCNTLYGYRVRAFNDDGISEYSNMASTKTLACQEETVPGECNGDKKLDVADITATILRIFEGRYQNQQGCDSNQDNTVDVADYVCTVLLIFGQSCGKPTMATLQADAKPVIALGALGTPHPGDTITIPVIFQSNGANISSLAFGMIYDPHWLHINPADDNRDGIPDAITFQTPPDVQPMVFSNTRQDKGTIAIFVGDNTPTLALIPDGTLLTITFTVSEAASEPRETSLLIMASPTTSFGDKHGRSIRGIGKGSIVRVAQAIYLPVIMR